VQHDDILARFAEVLGKTAKVDQAAITRAKSFRTDLGIDSLSLIDVAVAAEDEFQIRIPDEELERFETVGDFVDYVQQARSGSRS
jgi:acyl carrier protein